MGNEVEITITGKNKAAAAVGSVKNTFRSFASDLKSSMAKAGQESGEALGRGIVRGADGKLRDARGRFVAATGSVADFDRHGRSLGSRLARGVMSGMRDGMKRGSGLLADMFAGNVKGILSTPLVGTAISLGLVGAIGAAAPAVGAALTGMLTLGIGSAVVAAGAAALFHVEEINKSWSKAEQKRVADSNKQAEKLRTQWRELGRDVISGMKEASQPLLPVLDTTRSMLRDVGREFKPVLRQGLEIAKGPLERFVKNLGKSVKELAPSVAPLMRTFGALLDEIGPQLPGVFAEISDAVIGMATVVSENRDLIGGLFVGLLRMIPLVINGLTWLTGMFRSVMIMATNMADTWLAAMQSILEVLAQLPGPWQAWAGEAARSIQGTRNKLSAFKEDLENFPKIVKLEGNIRDLESKVAAAKKKLRDKNLTAPQASRVRANIRDLEIKIAQAKAAIRSLQGKTVTVTTVYRTVGMPRGMSASSNAKGGIIGGIGARRFATGGINGSGLASGSAALVGEQGPELVNLPFGSTVTPAGKTRSLMGGGFGSVSMAFRPGQSSSGGSTGGLTESLREVLSFREALDKLTGSIFGQERALSSYEAAWDSAGRSLKENGKTLNITKEKGRENRSALLALAEAAQEVVLAMDEMGRSDKSIIAKMKEQRAEFIKMARSMGLSKSSATALADKYGLSTTKVKSALTSSGKASGGIAGGWTLVGERGPELAKLPFGSNVISAGRSAAMLGASGYSGPAELHITLQVGTTVLGEVMIDPLRKAVQSRGGNVQAVLGRR